MKKTELSVLFHDEEIVVIAKPGGLLAVPGRGVEKQDCAAARMRRLFPAMITQPAVHRLDMATSGLMVLAITGAAHRTLSRQFAERQVAKRYLALLDGELTGPGGEIRLAFRLDPDNRPHQVYDPVHGKIGITRWRLLEITGKQSRVEFIPETGRTHQLRVHAAHPLGLNAPIVGDPLYGNGADGDLLHLHAEYLRFRHPVTGQSLEFHLPPPF
jgi:tRNA pseudouridine32 synthase/23S rRNA pseudouridine746 synthase